MYLYDWTKKEQTTFWNVSNPNWAEIADQECQFCVTFLWNLMVFVPQVKSDPFKKDSKKEGEDKTGSTKVPGEKRISTGLKATSK